MRTGLSATLAIAFAASITVAAQGPQTAPRPSTPPPATTHPDQTESAKPDAHFVRDAAADGLAEVALGKLVADQGASTAVKAFAQRMMADHSKVNVELSELAARKGIVLPSAMSGRHQAMFGRLSMLSGAELDHAYVSAMLRDHEKRVAAFRKEADSGQDDEVRAWAAHALPTLEQHLDAVRALNVRSTH